MPEYGGGGSAIVSLYVKRGTGTITAGQTSVNVVHGLGYAPTGAAATPTSYNGVDLKIDWAATDATNLVVAIQFADITDVTFTWIAS